MVELAYAESRFRAPEIAHRYGPQVHLLDDPLAWSLLARACSTCHPVDRANSARNSADAWRVLTIDMRERGAKVTDDEVEKLVEWLGRTKGTNANQ